jgi:hypothetical protein
MRNLFYIGGCRARRKLRIENWAGAVFINTELALLESTETRRKGTSQLVGVISCAPSKVSSGKNKKMTGLLHFVVLRIF